MGPQWQRASWTQDVRWAYRMHSSVRLVWRPERWLAFLQRPTHPSTLCLYRILYGCFVLAQLPYWYTLLSSCEVGDPYVLFCGNSTLHTVLPMRHVLLLTYQQYVSLDMSQPLIPPFVALHVASACWYLLSRGNGSGLHALH